MVDPNYPRPWSGEEISTARMRIRGGHPHARDAEYVDMMAEYSWEFSEGMEAQQAGLKPGDNPHLKRARRSKIELGKDAVQPRRDGNKAWGWAAGWDHARNLVMFYDRFVLTVCDAWAAAVESALAEQWPVLIVDRDSVETSGGMARIGILGHKGVVKVEDVAGIVAAAPQMDFCPVRPIVREDG